MNFDLDRATPPPDALSECNDRLLDAYRDYVEHVSPADMAMSLESARYILWLCETFEPHAVIDFGSGFTSYVLRLYASDHDGVHVVSVDDMAEWLALTAEFLRAHDLPTDGLMLFDEFDADRQYDLVVYDYAGGDVRNKQFSFATSLVASTGLIIYDDAHHRGHREKMFEATDEHGLDLIDISNLTRDSYRRFAALGVRETTTLAQRYHRGCRTPSDIYEHLPTFVDLVTRMDAQTVIELGTRGAVSTIAWLYGLEETGGHLWSVDIDPAPLLDHDRWTFIQGDDLDPKTLARLPDQADIVFIDTSHLYEQTLAELNVYRWRVRPGGRIVLHDTELRRPERAPVSPAFPVKRAVTEFCNEEGFVFTNDSNCFGLAQIAIPE